MRAARMWRLLLGLSVCLGFASHAREVAGYKGIPWGTACGEAVKRMEAKGFVFGHKEKLGMRAEGSSPWQPHLFLSDQDRRASCSAENADLELDTKQANPYVQLVAVSGDITITLLCRAGTFVGARLETGLNNGAASAMLTQAAGPPVRTLRADTCGDPYWKCNADHSILRARGDTVRGPRAADVVPRMREQAARRLSGGDEENPGRQPRRGRIARGGGLRWILQTCKRR